MKNYRKLLFLFVGLVALLTPTLALATSTEKPPFTMESVLPENQKKDSKATYFDLVVQPEQKQQVSIRFQNLSDKKITLQLSTNSAVTNANGVIDYNKTDAKKSLTAKYRLDELLTFPDEVELAAGETKVISGELSVPKDRFEGILLGGITATMVPEKATNDKQKSGLALTNQLAMTIGVVLTEDTQNVVEPELRLVQVQPGLSNGYTSVLATVQNINPQMVGQMTITGKVFKKGNSEVLKETVRKNQEMAPNSQFDFPVDWGKEELAAGDYTLKLVAQNKGHKWVFSKDFTIDKAQASKINEKAVGLKKDYTWLYITIGILLFILLLILAFLLGRRQRSEEKHEDS